MSVKRDRSIEREPGVYAATPGEFASVDQQRAALLEALRTSDVYSVTVMLPDGDAIHSALCAAEEKTTAFLVFAAVKAVRDMMSLLGGDPRVALGVVLAAIEEGIGA